MKIAVIGGGIVGLTTALQIKKELRNADITVYADNFDDTTSHVAAGIFRVDNSYYGPTEEITRAWINDSWNYYDEIRKTRDSTRAGIASVSCYIFANSSPNAVRNHWMEDLLPIYRKADEKEFNLVGGKWKYGSYLSTVITQCKYHLPWARQKLIEGGVKLVEKKINGFEELIDGHEFIMNCSGLGARELCNDRRLIPIRGQIEKVKAPWIKACFYGESDTYVIPDIDGNVTLGGSRYFASENKAVCPHEAAAIRERCVKLLPSIEKANVLYHAAGLRPYRENNVRVEIEKISHGTSKSTVVHNYGHGGYGVCTAPGTAKYAVSLAKTAHASSGSKL